MSECLTEEQLRDWRNYGVDEVRHMAGELLALRTENERLREALKEARPYVKGVYNQLVHTNARHEPAGVLTRIDAALDPGETRAELPQKP